METFIGDTVELVLKTYIDTSIYDTKRIKYRRPDGTSGQWDAETYGSDNTCVSCGIEAGDLDISGMWLVQAYLEHGNEKLHGEWAKLYVLDPLYES